MTIPRIEHPKPQFQRDSWMNLNGQWAFEIDNGRSGLARGLSNQDAKLSGEITVPFCPQSELSGVNYKDFINGAWYQRTVELTREQTSGTVFIHFGAVDYRCQVFVNGKKAGEHRGGYVSFRMDISELVNIGENVITVYAEDNERDPMIPRGKQSEEFFSHNCDYTRTTGIWQTVWLEFCPKTHLDSFRVTPNLEDGSLWISAKVCGRAALIVEAAFEGKPMGKASVEAKGDRVSLTLKLDEIHLWELGCGRLYDLTLTYGDDIVHSYAGMRSVALEGRKFLLNGKSVFQRTVLDQGFYPDGIYTAPSDEALVRDIQLSMSCGFNGARLHEKIFEERFLYHCDRLGYMVWGEFPNWGLDHSQPQAVYSVLPEWLEEVERDFNHPSIIGWCPFNETWDQNGRKQYDDVLRAVYLATKSADPTRPCIDTSGNYHVETDIYDLHDYDQNPESFKAHYDELAKGGELWEQVNQRQPYPRQKYDGKKPVFLSEYGGIGWALDEKAWGYGNSPKSPEEFIQRFRGLADALLDNPEIMGLCYTQLTNVEQEQNGLFTYEREPKFPVETFRDILSRKAAIED
ncbi:sugar-binding domain-containing protein [Oscillospiraceae bacterium 42-9]